MNNEGCMDLCFIHVGVNVQHLFSENCNRLVVPAFLSRQTCRCSLPVLPLRSQEKLAKDRPACFLTLCKYANMNVNVQGAVSHSCLCVSLQIENIDACLSFLAAKGVNIQGLSSEGKLDSCTSAFTGTGEVDPNPDQARPGQA